MPRIARVSSEMQVHADPPSVAEAAAEILVDAAADAIRARGRFTIALSGGSTPRLLYERLAGEHAGRIDWPRVNVFWGDERCVPEGSPESNYQAAHDALLSRVPIPPGNVHRVRGEHPDPHGAAVEYERMLKRFFAFPAANEGRFSPVYGAGRPADATPSGLRPESQSITFSRSTFDVILLGLGEDGHTASLFPGDPILDEKRHWVYAVKAPRGVSPSERITLTLPAIASAERGIFLVTGANKRGVLDAIRAGGDEASRLPAARVTTSRGVLWLADAAAAGYPSA